MDQLDRLCLRRRPVLGIVYAAVGFVGGLSWLASGIQNADEGRFAGPTIIALTLLFVVDWFFTNRICIDSWGITRAHWLGLQVHRVGHDAIRRVDFNSVPSLPLPARVIEIRTDTREFVLGMREYGDQGLRRLLSTLIFFHPGVSFSDDVDAFVARAERSGTGPSA